MSEPPDSTRSTTKREARGRAKTGGSGRRDARAKTVAPTLDEETAAALTLYNTYLVADREQQAHERALRKAEKAKDDAAAAVRELNDRKAPASETAAAETKYRDAVAALQRLRDGDTAALEDQDDDAGDDTAGDDAEATLDGDVPTTEDTGETSSVGVETSVGDDDLAGDEPAGVAG